MLDLDSLAVANLYDSLRSFDACPKAVHKLEEALRMIGVPTNNFNCAIDLGAAPGAWTHYLSKISRYETVT